MVGHGGSSAGSYLADPTFPIPFHCASIVAASTLRVKHFVDIKSHKYLINYEAHTRTQNTNCTIKTIRAYVLQMYGKCSV